MQAAYSFLPQPQYLRKKKSANVKLPDSYIFQIYETSYQRSKQLLHKNKREKKSRHNNRGVGGQKKQLKAVYIKEQPNYFEQLSC